MKANYKDLCSTMDGMVKFTLMDGLDLDREQENLKIKLLISTLDKPVSLSPKIFNDHFDGSNKLPTKPFIPILYLLLFN